MSVVYFEWCNSPCVWLWILMLLFKGTGRTFNWFPTNNGAVSTIRCCWSLFLERNTKIHKICAYEKSNADNENSRFYLQKCDALWTTNNAIVWVFTYIMFYLASRRVYKTKLNCFLLMLTMMTEYTAVNIVTLAYWLVASRFRTYALLVILTPIQWWIREMSSVLCVFYVL